MRRHAHANLSPFEILFAAPPYIAVTAERQALPSTALCEDAMLTYCTKLTSTLSDVRRHKTSPSPPARRLRPGKGPPQEELEGQLLARAIPRAPGDTNRSEDR